MPSHGAPSLKGEGKKRAKRARRAARDRAPFPLGEKARGEFLTKKTIFFEFLNIIFEFFSPRAFYPRVKGKPRAFYPRVKSARKIFTRGILPQRPVALCNNNY